MCSWWPCPSPSKSISASSDFPTRPPGLGERHRSCVHSQIISILLPMAAMMREPTLWILTVLAAEPQHGYGLIQETGRLTGHRVRLRAGALYAHLDRLQA